MSWEETMTFNGSHIGAFSTMTSCASYDLFRPFATGSARDIRRAIGDPLEALGDVDDTH